MKILGLLLMLGLMCVMTAMLTAMAADASARLSLADKPPAAPTLSVANASPVAFTAASLTPLAAPTPDTKKTRAKAKKRVRATCARVTSTCWGKR